MYLTFSKCEKMLKAGKCFTFGDDSEYVAGKSHNGGCYSYSESCWVDANGKCWYEEATSCELVEDTRTEIKSLFELTRIVMGFQNTLERYRALYKDQFDSFDDNYYLEIV